MSTFARAPEGAHEFEAADPALDAWFAERRRGREHSRRELEALVRSLALRPDLWRGWVAHSASSASTRDFTSTRTSRSG